MSINPELALSIKPIDIQNPVDQYGRAMALKNLMLQNQTSQQAFDDNQKLRSLYSSATGDPETLRNALYASGVPGGVQQGVALDKDIIANRASQNANIKSQLDIATHKLGIMASAINSLGPNPDIGQLHQTVAQLKTQYGIDPPNDLPQTQDQVAPFMAKVVQSAQTVGQQLEQAHRKFEENQQTLTLQNTQKHQAVEEKQGAQRIAQGAEHVQQGWLQTDPFGTLRAAAKMAPPAGSTGGVAVGQPGADQVIGDDFLKTIPKTLADQVKALAEGRLAFPAGFALKSPYWQNMLQMVSQYDPSFDAVNFNARAAMRKDATSGTMAKSATAINTAIGHLDTLSKAADALNNTNFQAYNTLTNWIASNSGDPRVKVFENTRKAVVDELTRVWRGTGGAEGDIKSWEATLGAASSPAQLHAVIQNIGELMESRLHALEDQYAKGMGTTENGLQLVAPKNRDLLNRLQNKASEATGKPSSKGSPQSNSDDPVVKAINTGQWSADEEKKYQELTQKQLKAKPAEAAAVQAPVQTQPSAQTLVQPEKPDGAAISKAYSDYSAASDAYTKAARDMKVPSIEVDRLKNRSDALYKKWKDLSNVR